MADADPVAKVFTTDPPLAVVALEPGVDGLRTAAARAVRACRGGGTVAWALDASLPLPLEDQVRALAEGAVIGGYDGRRWRSVEQPRGVERFVICGGGEGLAPVAERAALVARWINVARELVDAPPNVISPAGLAERAAALPGVSTEAIDAVEAGLGALAAVGGSSPAKPLLLVLRYEPPGAPDAPRLGARREGRHVRHGRLLPQAAVGHRPSEGRHGAAARRSWPRWAPSPSSGSRCRSPGSCRPARTCSAAARSAPPTSSRPLPASPSRSRTPMPRAV